MRRRRRASTGSRLEPLVRGRGGSGSLPTSPLLALQNEDHDVNGVAAAVAESRQQFGSAPPSRSGRSPSPRKTQLSPPTRTGTSPGAGHEFFGEVRRYALGSGSKKKKNQKPKRRAQSMHTAAARRRHQLTLDDIDWHNPTVPTMGADEMETKKLCLPYQSELSYIELQIQQRLAANVVKTKEQAVSAQEPIQAWQTSRLNSSPLTATTTSSAGPRSRPSSTVAGRPHHAVLSSPSSPAAFPLPLSSTQFPPALPDRSGTLVPITSPRPPASPVGSGFGTSSEHFEAASLHREALAHAHHGNEGKKTRKKRGGDARSSRPGDRKSARKDLLTTTAASALDPNSQESAMTRSPTGGEDAETVFRRQERAFSVEKCFIEFSKFCQRIPPPPRDGGGQIRPQLRRLTWILPLVESIYDKRWLVEQRHTAPDTATAAFSIPHFTFSTLAEDVGLSHMVHQACWDLLFTMVTYRDDNDELETFSNFLGEVFDNDDLMIFLHARSLAQQRLGLNLRSKHKLQDSSISKLFLPRSVLPLTQSHPELREGTQHVYLTRTACVDLAIELLEDRALGLFFVQRDVEPLLQKHHYYDRKGDEGHAIRVGSAKNVGYDDGSCNEGPVVVSRMLLSKFLEAVLLEFRSTPQSLVEFLKYGDAGKNIETLNQLQASSQKEVLVQRAQEALAECADQLRTAHAALANLKSNPPRKAAEMAAFQVQLRIAENRHVREKRKVKQARAALQLTEEETSGVWKVVLRDARHAREAAKDVHLNKPGPTQPVTDAIVRFIKHVRELFEKDKAGKSKMEAYAETWRDQLKKLRDKYSAMMVAWIRRKRHEKEERQRARAKLDELRRLRDQKRAHGELKLMRAEEERMRRYLLQLAKLQADMDADAREQYLRKLRAQRRAWADERFLHRQREFQRELVRRWHIFRICGDMRRLRIKRTLAHYFGAPDGWLGYHLFLARARRAAVKLQTRYRMLAARKRMQHVRDVFALTFRLQQRTLGGIFAEWRRVSILWKRARLLARHVLDRDYRARFGQWRRSIEHQRWQVKHGVTHFQAVVRGGLQRWRQKKLVAAKVLQGFSRQYLAQSVLHRALRRKNRNQLVARKYLKKLLNQLLQRSLRAWAFVTRRAELVRRRFADYLRGNLHDRFNRWHQFLDVNRDERFRGASRLQATWRARAARMLVLNIKSLNGAVRRLQKVYRGLRGRRMAAWRERAEKAALRVAARWRGHRGRALFTRLKLQIVLEDMKEKRYARVKEHFQYDRAWLLDNDGNNLLMLGAQQGSKRMVKICLRNGMDPATFNRLGKTAMHLAASSYALGTDKVVNYLCEKGTDPNYQDYKGRTPLMDAASTMCVANMRILLRWGADFNLYNHEGRNALHLAVLANRPGSVRALCEAGMDANIIDYEYRTPLHHVAYKDLDLVGEVLIEHGADTSLTDPEGYPPLHYAAVANNLKALEMLLNCGANPDFRDRADWAALHHAANANNVEVAQVLCGADADLDVKDRDEDGPLHLAIAGHHQAMTEVLLGFGANVNMQNADGMTPLHIAARENNVHAAELLMTYDLEVNTRDYQGHTALGVARLYRHMDVVRIIENRFETQLVEAPVHDPDTLNRWEKRYDEEREEYYYYNTKTGERRADTNNFADLLGSTSGVVRVLEKRLLDTKPGQDLSAADYADYFEDEVGHIAREKKREKGARMMQACWRRYQGRNNVLDKIREYIAASKVQSRWRGHRTFRAVRDMQRQAAAASAIQRCFRRFTACRFARVVYLDTWTRKRRSDASTDIQRVARGYLHGRRLARTLRIRRDGPQDPTEWEDFVKAAKDERITDPLFKKARYLRTEGIFEEYCLLLEPSVKFYRHTLTGVYSWDEPESWGKRERLAAREFAEQAATGFTTAERQAAIVLQNRYRGKMARAKFRTISKGLHIMMTAEDRYLRDPHNIVNMCNYMLFLLCFKHAYDRVRPIALQCIREMEARGPDNPFVLYTFAIFLTATAEEDWGVIRALIARADAANVSGHAYDAAYEGFFRRAQTQQKKNANARFHFAIATMFVKRDYETAEIAFLAALEHMSMQDTLYERVSSTFDFMLQELMGQPDMSAAEKWRVYAERSALEHWKAEKKAMDEATLLKGVLKLQAVARKLQVYARIDDFNLRYTRVTGEDGVVRWHDQDTGAVMDERPNILKSGEQRAEREAASQRHGASRFAAKLTHDQPVTHGQAYPPSKDIATEQREPKPGITLEVESTDNENDTEVWEEHLDDDGATPFFYNPATGESRWERPLHHVREAAKMARVLGNLASTSEPEAESDAGVEWEEVLDTTTDTPYYYNPQTGESRWEKPMRLVKKLNALNAFGGNRSSDLAGTFEDVTPDERFDTSGVQSEDEAWEEVMDTESNTPYYYNPQTGESRWEKPLSMARSLVRAAQSVRAFENAGSKAVENTSYDFDEGDVTTELVSASDDVATEVATGDTDADEDEWEEIVDEDSSSTYFYNPQTGESRWTRPMRMARKLAAMSAFAAGSRSGGEDAHAADANDSAGGTMDDGWEEHLDDDGFPFYFHPETGESRWEKPMKAADADETGAIQASTADQDDLLIVSPDDQVTTLPENWESVLDQDGYEYFYNAVTGISQYEFPDT